MIAGFRSWANGIYNRVRRANEVVRVPENSGLTVRQQQTGRKALKILGIEESDGLNKQELVIFLYAVGLNPTDDVIDSKLRAFKLHDVEKLTFGHVCHVWQSMLQDLTDEEEILRRAFQFFDKDGNGEISIPELRTTMHELGDLLSEEEILAFMTVMDVNNDGVIGFEEFISTLKTQTPELIHDDELGDDGGDFTARGGEQYVGGEETTSPRGRRSSVSNGPRARASAGSEEDASASQQPQQAAQHLQQLQQPQQGATGRGQPVGEGQLGAEQLPCTHGGKDWRSVYDMPGELSGRLTEPAALQQGEQGASNEEEEEQQHDAPTTAAAQRSAPLPSRDAEHTRPRSSPHKNIMLIPASSPSRARASPRLGNGAAPMHEVC